MSTGKIIYQGVPGSYSYEAMLKYFGDNITFEHKEFFGDVFKEVSLKKADYGVVPVENSTTGGVNEVFDLLSAYDQCFICGEICLEITHHLMSIKSTNLDNIKKVYSHPQALNQCKDYIRAMNFEAIPASNTAASAKLIQEKNDPTFSAIGSLMAAKFYDLKILSSKINNYFNNITKFIVITHQMNYDKTANKISLILVTPHQPGALYEALGCFAKNKINILKLESRPIKDVPWQYSFFVDIEGNLQHPNIMQALEDLKKICPSYKILGNYKPSS
ncbi:MAG: prephenate dehydratase [Eubacteriales bacterium]